MPQLIFRGLLNPIIQMSRERLSRAGIGWCIGFATPFITLPVTNRLALKGIAKTYKSFLNNENNIIQISNSDLATAEKAEQALKQLAEQYKFSPGDIIKKCGGYEKFRKRMINSKTAVRAFDYLFTAGCLGAIGYFNGVASASINSTEMKDNLIRSSIGGITFFGGDILIGSLLAQISDKFFNTKIINRECEQNFIKKILPAQKHLKEMSGRDRKAGTLLFWINMAPLSAIISFGVPAFLNKMILKDVEKSKSDNQGL